MQKAAVLHITKNICVMRIAEMSRCKVSGDRKIIVMLFRKTQDFRDDVNFIAENSLKWLQELFDLEDYDYNSQRIFNYYPDFFVKFLRNELFSDDVCVDMIFPRGMYEDNNRMSYKKITAYFLLNQHYSKLNATQKDDNIKEDLSKLDRVESEADFDSIKNTAKKTQWWLYADDLAHQYIWAG